MLQMLSRTVYYFYHSGIYQWSFTFNRIDSERGRAPNGMVEWGRGGVLVSHVEHHVVGSRFWLEQPLRAKELLRPLGHQHAKAIVLPCCNNAVPDLIKLTN